MDHDNGNLPSENLRKLFIGGLDRSTSEEDIRTALGSYGNIVDLVVIKDGVTKQSRGFGFVTFDTVEAVDSVLQTRRDNGTLDIHKKSVEIKRAIPRDDTSETAHLLVKKMFVGGIPNISEEAADGYIRKWCAPVVPTSIDLLKQKEDPSKLRGFGFLEFDHEDFVDKLIIMQGLFMNGKKVEVKKAAPKDQMEGGGRGRGRGGARGGTGGGARGSFRGGRGSRGGGYSQQAGGYGSGYSSGGGYGGGGGYDSYQQDDGYGGGSYGGGDYSSSRRGGSGYGSSAGYSDYGTDYGTDYSYSYDQGGGGGGRGGRGGSRYRPY